MTFSSIERYIKLCLFYLTLSLRYRGKALNTQGDIKLEGNVQRENSLYTPEQRIRRDTTKWTLVQGILAPLQFVVFLVSLILVFRAMTTGLGYEAATISIILKTLILYVIMITGSIWEKVVFNKYLFADSFFWEDVFSMLVLALHTAYLYGLIFTNWSRESLLYLALAAYCAYVINAVQFILKLRMARLESDAQTTSIKKSGNNYPQSKSFTMGKGASA